MVGRIAAEQRQASAGWVGSQAQIAEVRVVHPFVHLGGS